MWLRNFCSVSFDSVPLVSKSRVKKSVAGVRVATYVS